MKSTYLQSYQKALNARKSGKTKSINRRKTGQVCITLPFKMIEQIDKEAENSHRTRSGQIAFILQQNYTGDNK